MKSLAAALLLASIATPALAAADPCTGADVYRINVPIYPDRPGSATYDFAFQVRRSNYDPRMPWVVVMPGGPGSASIGSDEGAIPLWYNVIFTDPRGAGCNALPGGALFPHDSLTTDYLSGDVLAMIKWSGILTTSYALYGHSYGTVEATVLTARIEHDGLPAPKALVLEGTVGRYFQTFDNYLLGVRSEWARAKSFVDPGVLSALAVDGYLGHSAADWSIFLNGRLKWGDLPGAGGKPLVSYELNALASPDPATVAAAQASIASYMTSAHSGLARFSPDMTVWLGCRELWGTFSGSAFSGGDFIAAGPDRCAAEGLALSPGYDVARYGVKTPIFYLAGGHDPAVPYMRAIYDDNTQIHSLRTFVYVPGAGHDPLESQLRYLNESSYFWDYAIYAPASLQASLDRTGLGIQVIQTAAQP